MRKPGKNGVQKGRTIEAKKAFDISAASSTVSHWVADKQTNQSRNGSDLSVKVANPVSFP